MQIAAHVCVGRSKHVQSRPQTQSIIDQHGQELGLKQKHTLTLTGVGLETKTHINLDMHRPGLTGSCHGDQPSPRVLPTKCRQKVALHAAIRFSSREHRKGCGKQVASSASVLFPWMPSGWKKGSRAGMLFWSVGLKQKHGTSFKWETKPGFSE